jgi:V8-like Glu-specific endopeptidase
MPITSQGHIASYSVRTNEFLIDKNAWPGASGSPVYGAEGEVIGLIIQRGLGDGSGLAYARPADFIVDFLRRQEVPIKE